MLTFDEKFFEAEVREGFRVTSMMKHCWAAEMELLSEIDRICKKHQIQYFADWGTLLGAVRHNGFIPWDDDLDIGMKRPDYERFWRIAREELPQGYQVLNAYTDDDYILSTTKITTGNTLQFSQEHLRAFHGCPYVIIIDIFPIDYVPRVKEEEEMQIELVNIVNSAAIHMNDPDTSEASFQETVKMIETVCGVTFNDSMPIFQQLAILGEQLCDLYGPDDADYLTAMHRLIGGQPYYVPKEAYDTAIMMPFENIEIPVPVGYDEILKLKYGDYMQRVNCGGAHDYPYYKEQAEVLRKMLIENHIPLSAFYFEE